MHLPQQQTEQLVLLRLLLRLVLVAWGVLTAAPAPAR